MTPPPTTPPHRRAPRWVPDGLLAHPLLYGSPLEGPARTPGATDLDRLLRGARVLNADPDPAGAARLLGVLITKHAPR